MTRALAIGPPLAVVLLGLGLLIQFGPLAGSLGFAVPVFAGYLLTSGRAHERAKLADARAGVTRPRSFMAPRPELPTTDTSDAPPMPVAPWVGGE